MDKMTVKKLLYSAMVLGSISSSIVPTRYALAETIPQTQTVQQQGGQNQTSAVNLSDWDITTSGDTVTITNYHGNDKDVVIPLSGDLNCTTVKITKNALRAAAESADKQGGTLSNSTNDTSGKGLISDNSGDDNPNDSIVDYSSVFANFKNITKINLSKWNIVAKDGQDGASNQGNGTYVVWGKDGETGESINISKLFSGDRSLSCVYMDDFVGQAGNGGRGGDADAHYYGEGRDRDHGDGYGGKGGYAGNFNSNRLFDNCTRLKIIDIPKSFGKHGIGGNGGNGTGGKGYGDSAGKGCGGYGYQGGNGVGGDAEDNSVRRCRGGDGVGGIGFSNKGGDGIGGKGSDYAGGDGSRGFGGNGGNGTGGDSFGGNGGNGKGGYGGKGNFQYPISGPLVGGDGGNGGNGVGGKGYEKGGSGGNGTGGGGGEGAYCNLLSGTDGKDGDGTGGDGYEKGGTGKSGTFHDSGMSKNGNRDSNLILSNCPQNIQDLYQKYVGNTDKSNMYPSLVIKEQDFSVKAKSSYKFTDSVILHDANTNADITASNLGNVTVTVKNASGTTLTKPTDAFQKVGDYNVVYTYKKGTPEEMSGDMTLHVTSAESVNVHNSTLLVGEPWKAEDNFDSATDQNGDPLDFSGITVTGADQVPVTAGTVTQAGSHSVNYKYNKTTQTATVAIVDIKTKQLVTQGLNDPWNQYNGLASVTSSDGVNHSDAAYFKANVQVTACVKGAPATTVDPTTLTANEGEYTVTYTFQGKSKVVDVKVEEKILKNSSVIPADLDFGKLDIQYQRNQQRTSTDNNGDTTGSIALKDTRSADGEGFKLEAKQNGALKGETTGKELKKSQISFDVENVKNSANKKIVVGDGKDSTIKLDPTKAVNVLSAAKGDSRGETTADVTDFTLTIPKDEKKAADTYKGSITWTLSDTIK